jgi:Zinc binding domain
MADQCCSIPEAGSSTCELTIVAARGACPTNGKIGKPINTLTLKAMLARPLTELCPVEYRFCPDADCPTVYYSVDGLQTFVEADLRERVYQKHPQERDIYVCYCFQHTVGEIVTDANTLDGAEVVTEINRAIKNGQCACDIRNPQGSCCLGNINSVVKRAQQEKGVIK